MAEEPRDDVTIEYPNRGKASTTTTKLIVILLLLVSVGLMLVVMIGGWNALEGAKAMLIAYMLIYLILAFFTARWNRGVLPLSAALGIILLIFAAIAGPEWFARDKEGFTNPTLDEPVLGLLTLLLVPVQILLIGFSAQGFRQGWNVEVERPIEGARRGRTDDPRDDRFGEPGAAPA